MSHTDLLLAVDGGASKTDVWLLNKDGTTLGIARGEGSNHQFSGLEGAMGALDAAIMAAARDAGLSDLSRPIASTAVFCLAGLDLPVDEERLLPAVWSRNWATSPIVVNDSMAVLRAGARSGWGVAVVCGSGLNCVGRGPDGSIVRFPSLGELSGDLAAGGSWLGVRALGLALRSRDGRGESTVLAELVPSHFDRADVESVLAGVYSGELGYGRLLELARVCMDAAAAGDRVASGAVAYLADEASAMITAAATRLDLQRAEVEVVFGGGLFDSAYQGFRRRIEATVRTVVPRSRFCRLEAPPALGAALLALDAVGASEGAKARLRESAAAEVLGEAF